MTPQSFSPDKLRNTRVINRDDRQKSSVKCDKYHYFMVTDIVTMSAHSQQPAAA